MDKLFPKQRTVLLFVSGTFKIRKMSLQREGYNPNLISDPLFFYDSEKATYRSLDSCLYSDIIQMKLRLWRRPSLWTHSPLQFSFLHPPLQQEVVRSCNRVLRHTLLRPFIWVTIAKLRTYSLSHLQTQFLENSKPIKEQYGTRPL